MKASKTGLITAPLSNPEINVATGTCNTTQCPTQECTEVFKSDCVLYTGPDLSCQSTTIVNTDDTVTEAIQSVVGYFCANGGGGGIGTQGAQGPQGSQGSQGTQGVQGVQGRIGSQGAQGPQGTQGVQGLRGMQGVQGPQGTQGIQGNQGIQGIQGSQGVQGIQGSKGVNGLQGSQGPQGLDGQYAAQGVQGPQGLQGIQGIQGSRGLQGSTGEQGGYGPTGLQGAQGPQGVQGAQGIGNNGSQGPQGPQGSQGSQGIQGGGFNQSQGTQGTQGSIGNQGITGTGTQGAQGPQGSLGTQGTIGTSIQGTRGSQGLQGSQGSQGTQGIQGIDGLFAGQGAQGATGIQGPEGVQGPAGSGGGGTGGGRCSTDSTLIASTSGYFVSQGDGVTFIGNNEFCGWNGCLWNDERECARETPYTSLTNTIPMSIDLAIFDEVRLCGTAIYDLFDPETDSGRLMVGLGAITCNPGIDNYTTRCLLDPTQDNQSFASSDYGIVCFDRTYTVAESHLNKCADHLIVYLGKDLGPAAHIKFTWTLTAVKTCVDTYYDVSPCCGGPNQVAYGSYTIGFIYVDSITAKCFTVMGYGSAATPTVSLVNSLSYNDCADCIIVYPCPT
jgi:hypothetical protein